MKYRRRVPKALEPYIKRIELIKVVNNKHEASLLDLKVESALESMTY